MLIVGITMSMDESIRDHLEAIDAARDVKRLLRGGAHADRTHPVALEWLRRWRPTGTLTVVPDCSCAVGRCAVCN
jgi:hypothetical protein